MVSMCVLTTVCKRRQRTANKNCTGRRVWVAPSFGASETGRYLNMEEIMKFKINHNSKYKELEIKTENFTTTTGLMDKNECVTLAIELIEAANDLLLDTDYEAQTDILANVLECLE